MTNRSTKFLKIILFIIVFVWMMNFSLNHGSDLNLDTVSASLFMASLAYLLATLFGFALSTSGNYIIALAVTVALTFFLAFNMDKLTNSVSWMSDDLWMIVIIAAGVICVVRDLIFIKRSIFGVRGKESDISQKPEESRSIREFRESMKKDPRMVLDVSNYLETQLGRKPAYDEIMAFIDTLDEAPENAGS